MRYATVCSGIEAPSAAWDSLGWQPVFFSEIEKFPNAVLSEWYPDVPNLGDMTEIDGKEWYGEVDVLIGGTPCQSFSVAGLRKSLEDARGNLTVAFAWLANDMQPDFVVWENVPGVLSSKDNAFGCLLGALAGEDEPLTPPGGKWTNAGYVLGPERAVAWRVLDAQYFGVAQRRRRVFVVACPRDGADPREILFEREGVRRDTPPSRSAGKNTAPTLSARTKGGGGLGTDTELDGGLVAQSVSICPTLRAGGNSTGGDRPPGTDVDTVDSLLPVAKGVALRGREGGGTAELTGDVATALRASQGGGDKPHVAQTVATGTGQRYDAETETLIPLQEINKRTGQSTDDPRAGIGIANDGDPMFTLQAGAQHGVAYEYATVDVTAFKESQSGVREDEPHATLDANKGSRRMEGVREGNTVRRLTPTECERLQGFPDGWTDIPYRNKSAANGPRYKALGNSMAVPVVRWIGERIQSEVEINAELAAIL